MRDINLSARVRSLQQRQQDQTDDDDAVAVEGHKPQVPDDDYFARYTGHSTALLFGKRAHKVFLNFEICEGKYQGIKLARPFRVRQVVGRTGAGGKFTLSAGGDLYRTLVRLLDVKTRPDRVSLRPLRNMLFKVHTQTITRDRDDNELAEGVRYSIIDTIEDGLA